MIRHHANYLAACCVLAALLAAGCGDPQARMRGDQLPATPEPETPREELTLAQLAPPLTELTPPAPATPLDESAAATLAQAEQFLDEDLPARATALLNPLANDYPDHPRILGTLGRACALTGRREQAMDCLSRAAELDPTDLRNQLALARMQADARRYGEAIGSLRHALAGPQAAEDDPLTGEVLLDLAELLAREGYTTAALETFARLQERLEAHPMTFAASERLQPFVLAPEQLWTRQGELLIELGRYDQAADVLDRSLRHNRSDRETAALLMQALLESGQLDRAEQTLIMLAGEGEQQPQLPELIAAMCRVACDGETPARLAAELQRRNLLDGETAGQLAATADRLGRPQQAVDILTTLLANSPGNAPATRRLAAIYARQGRHEAALRQLAQLLGANPDATETVDRSIHQILAMRPPANLEWSFVVQIDSEPLEGSAGLHYVAGRLAQARDDDNVAIRQHRRAIEADKTFLPAYEALAGLYIRQDRQTQLNALLKQAAKADPESYWPWYLRGRVLLTQGRSAEALDALKEARTRNPQHVPTLMLLARSSLATGEVAEAVATLADAIRSDPQREEAYRALFALLLAAGQDERAEQVAAALMRNRPDSAVGRIMQAELALRQQRLDEAREILQDLRRTEGDSPTIELLAVQVDLAGMPAPLPATQLEQITNRLVRIVESRPDETAPKQLLAELIDRYGPPTHELAVDVWRRLHEAHPRRQDFARAYALALLKVDRKNEAIAVLSELVESYPRDLSARQTLIDALKDTGRTDEATAQARHVQDTLDTWIEQETSPRRRETLQNDKLRFFALAELYEELVAEARRRLTVAPENQALQRLVVSVLSEGEQIDLAAGLLAEWIAADPGNEAFYRRMQIALFTHGKRTARAIDVARAWIESESRLALPRVTLISLLAEAGRLEEAQQTVDAWIAEFAPITQPASAPATQPASAPTTQPSDALSRHDAILSLSREWAVRLLMMRGLYEQALQRCEQYLSDEGDSVAMMTYRATCLEELGRDDEALAAMEAAAAAAGEDASMSNNLGYMYANRGIRLEQAERMIRTALAESPRETAFLDSLAWVFYKQGRFADAARIFEQLVSDKMRETHDPVMFDHAGDTAWRLGQSDRAVDLWRRAAELAAEAEYPSADVKRTLREAPAKAEAAEAGEQPNVAPLGKDQAQTPTTQPQQQEQEP